MESQEGLNKDPKIFEKQDFLTPVELEERIQQEIDFSKTDEIDNYEIFDIIRHIQDPEHPLTLETLNIVTPKLITVTLNTVKVFFVPTIPHCSMSQTIGLMIKVKLLRCLPKIFKIDVFIYPGTHNQEKQLNRQINDKERISAALENQNVVNVLKKGLINTDFLPDTVKIVSNKLF